MKKKGSIFTYMVLVAAVLLVKVLGLVRNMLMSNMYGTTIEASAFTAVSNLPLVIFDVTFGTAISAAFVPVFNEKLTKFDKKTANKFASNFVNIVLVISVIIVAFGMLFPEVAVKIVASGFDAESGMNIAVPLMRIMMPIICFACCTFIFIGVLQSYGEFIAPALVSLFSNLAMILYLILLNKEFGIYGLAVSLCFGWFLQSAFLIPFLKKKKFKYSFGMNFRSPDIKKVAILTLPLFVASLAQPINQLISTNFSSTIEGNPVATINYAYQAYFIVAGVFSYALTNMFFPEMSRRFTANDIKGATHICKDMLSTISAIIMPIMAFMCAAAVPIIKILYERGKFTAGDTAQVATLLMIYTLGMLFLSWQDILNKYFYSMQKSVVPMICAAVGISANFLISWLLTPVIGLEALALSTVISGFIMTLMLSLFSLKYTKFIFDLQFAFEMVKLMLSGVAVYLVCKGLMTFNSAAAPIHMQIIFVVLLLLASLIVYLFLLLILRSNNLSKILTIFKKGGKSDNVQ